MARRIIRKELTAICPACGADIQFRKHPRISSFVTCRSCESLLEVVDLDPLTLEWGFEEPFDDYDDYEDEEFYGNSRGNRGADDEWDDKWDDEWGP